MSTEAELQRRFSLTPIGAAYRALDNAWNRYSNHEASGDECRADASWREKQAAEAALLALLIPLSGVARPMTAELAEDLTRRAM